MNHNVLLAILDSMPDPVVFVDTGHIIRYLNKAAAAQYQKPDHPDLLGRSIFDCHNKQSRQIILDIFKSFMDGADERFLSINKSNQKVYMRAVRNNAGEVIGYYERYEVNV